MPFMLSTRTALRIVLDAYSKESVKEANDQFQWGAVGVPIRLGAAEDGLDIDLEKEAPEIKHGWENLSRKTEAARAEVLRRPGIQTDPARYLAELGDMMRSHREFETAALALLSKVEDWLRRHR